MKKERALRLAYVAGFIDGEGCIRICRRGARNGRSKGHSLLVTTSQKDGRPMDFLYGLFGGCIVFKRHGDGGFKTDRDNWLYEWRITDRKAGEMLKEILPFLTYKKPQAELAIRFQERKNQARKAKIRDGTKNQFAALSESEIQQREQMFKRMTELKHEYVMSKNPNVLDLHCPSLSKVQPERLSETTPNGDAIV